MSTHTLPDGATLAFDQEGAGPDVVFLHPGFWDRRTWDPQIATFVGAGYRVTRFDFRGYGESSRLTGEPYSYADDLLSLLDGVGVEQAALVGCSIGGGAAIDFTLEHPDRVWALVPVASGVDDGVFLEEEADWWEERERPVKAAMEAGDTQLALEHSLEPWMAMGKDDPAGARIRQIAFDNIHTLDMDTSAQRDIDPPSGLRLGEIDIPTLVIEAEHDPPEMHRLAGVIAHGVLDARHVKLEADHVVNLRAPEAFDAVVLPFLDEHRP
jgi:pimeloyl-ACP methyl ester carboxylesterase